MQRLLWSRVRTSIGVQVSGVFCFSNRQEMMPEFLGQLNRNRVADLFGDMFVASGEDVPVWERL
jgi:hypothetical protein